jgi:hypothetical protein
MCAKNKKAESSSMEDKMKGLILAVALLLAVRALALAQDAGQRYRGEGYVFIGDGLYPEYPGHLGIGHVGGGGEVNLAKGFSVGSELCAIGRPGNGAGLFSIDASYRLLSSSSKSKLVPFVDAGYTRSFDNYAFIRDNLFNFGGGIHYWPFKRVGLRLDFRDYVNHSPYVTSHFPALRIGLAVR